MDANKSMSEYVVIYNGKLFCTIVKFERIRVVLNDLVERFGEDALKSVRVDWIRVESIPLEQCFPVSDEEPEAALSD